MTKKSNSTSFLFILDDENCDPTPLRYNLFYSFDFFFIYQDKNINQIQNSLLMNTKKIFFSQNQYLILYQKKKGNT